MNLMQTKAAIEALSGWASTDWINAFEGKVFAGSAAVAFYAEDPRQVESHILKPMLLEEAGKANVIPFTYEGKPFYVLKDTALCCHAIHAQAHGKAEAYLFDDYLMAIDLMALADLPAFTQASAETVSPRERKALTEILEAKRTLERSNAKFKASGFSG